MRKITVVILGLFLMLASCQSNDICTLDNPSTPGIIIKFYDIERPGRTKAVKNLNATEIDADVYYFSEPVSDTVIRLPLRTDQNTTTWNLFTEKTIGDTIETKHSVLKINYIPEEIYISRACGYSIEFLETEMELLNENSAENWIKALEFPRTNTIENEREPHLYIFH